MKLDMFSRHELIKAQDGYTLVLYVEKQTSEFGEEFLHSLSSKSKKLQSDSLNYIKKYIDDNYKDIKIDSVKIMLGTILIASIGYGSLTVTGTAENPAVNLDQSQTKIIYTVKSGDTLYKIAKNTGTTISQLMKLNNLSSSMIFPGQQLKTKEIIGSYTVKAGDTLYGISMKFGISISKLKEINKLTGDTIYPGQKLNLAAVSAPVVPTIPTTPKVPATPTTPTTPKAPTTPVTPATGNLILVNKKYTLSASYVPSSLVNPNVPTANSSKTKMTPEAARALEALFLKAKQDNINLTAISGYRSYERQNEIFASNINKYGSAAAANQFSARPGQSEHQTGLAMDVSSPSVNFALTQSYAQTREGKWLIQNASQFGFILRYPKGKENITGYQFEPWHLRYVGKAAAQEIASRNITLEEYLNRV